MISTEMIRTEMIRVRMMPHTDDQYQDDQYQDDPHTDEGATPNIARFGGFNFNAHPTNFEKKIKNVIYIPHTN